MRVAFYAPLKAPDHPVPSGDRRTAQLLFQALQLAGHEPFLASRLRSFDRDGDPGRQARLARIGRRTADRLLRGWATDPGSAPELWFTYHLYHKAPDWLGPAVSAALGIPYVACEASLAPKQAGGRWDMGHHAVEQAIRQAQAVIGLNPADRACVLPAMLDPDRWFTLPPFLDAAAFRPADRPQLGPVRLITVAMMRPGDKLASFRVLARALGLLLDFCWTLDVIGDGPARAEIIEAFRPLGTRVNYRGALEGQAIAAALGEAGVFVWPAINEAFGMALLEAQAAGLPVVAGNSGGVGAVIADGATGLLVPPGDDWAFAEALRQLLQEPGKRAAMGEAARAKVLRKHDLPITAQRLGSIIERLGEVRAA